MGIKIKTLKKIKMKIQFLLLPAVLGSWWNPKTWVDTVVNKVKETVKPVASVKSDSYAHTRLDETTKILNKIDSIMFGSNTMLICHPRQNMLSNGLNTIGVRLAVLKTTTNSTIMKNMTKSNYLSRSLLPVNMSPTAHHQHGFILKMHIKDCIWLISQLIMQNQRKILRPFLCINR